MELQYDPGWSASPLGRPLSLSLPFNLGNAPLAGDSVRHYFEGLLPDSDVLRKRVAARFKTASTDAFDLLGAIGRDCVGAVQLLPEGEEPHGFDRVDGVVVDDDAIERHLREVVNPGDPAGTGDPDDDFRISLAGAQDKDAYLWWNGRWMKPRGATPTTHIFKLPLGLVGGRRADFTTSVDNEWLCLRVLKAYGLPTAEATIATFGTQRVLVVKRFDRAVGQADIPILRVPQEDFCQATGTSPFRKYESEGGPGLMQIFALLRQSSAAERDMTTVMAAQIVFWMLRAPDGHAKNFSISLLAGNRFRLTPLYDVMSAYPALGTGPNQWDAHDLSLAMALLGKNRHYQMKAIQRRHFNSTARRVGYADGVEPLIKDLVERTPSVVEATRNDLPSGFSGRVADAILNGLLHAARELEAMPAD